MNEETELKPSAQHQSQDPHLQQGYRLWDPVCEVAKHTNPSTLSTITCANCKSQTLECECTIRIEDILHMHSVDSLYHLGASGPLSLIISTKNCCSEAGGDLLDEPPGVLDRSFCVVNRAGTHNDHLEGWTDIRAATQTVRRVRVTIGEARRK